MLLAGCGAVGNACAGALYQVDGLAGKLTFLDDQVLSVSNLGRYYMSTLSDLSRPKAEILSRLMPRGHLSSEPIQGEVESLDSGFVTDFDLVLSLLDNRDHHNARLHLQSLLPRRIIHAATQDLTIAVANIDFLNGICLGCLFSPRQDQISTAYDPSCGGVTLRIAEEDYSAAVSFVSAASGFLAASELIKMSSPTLQRFALRNYLTMSLFSPELADVCFRQKDPACICLCSEPFRQAAFSSKCQAANNLTKRTERLTS